jgi:5-carboxymethyl-2-hydroxymuconate isomerase
MAHAVVEYTDNLTDQADIRGLLVKIAAHMRNSNGVFPTGGIRIRANRLSEYVIADGEDDYAFVNIVVQMGPGRSAEFKKQFFDDLFEIIKAHFATLFASRYLALSLYIAEVNEANSYKQNNIHVKFPSAKPR